MKAVCIIGSPRKNGSSALIIDKMIEGMNQIGVESKRHYLSEYSIEYCMGCKNCYKEGEVCVIKDDMDIIMSDIKTADIVVVGSPDYWGDITGQLKVFIDRNLPYCDTNDNREVIGDGKKGIAIAVRAGTRKEESMDIINSINHYYGHLGIIPMGEFTVERVDTLEDLLDKEDILANAFEFGRTILSSDYS